MRFKAEKSQFGLKGVFSVATVASPHPTSTPPPQPQPGPSTSLGQSGPVVETEAWGPSLYWPPPLLLPPPLPAPSGSSWLGEASSLGPPLDVTEVVVVSGEAL